LEQSEDILLSSLQHITGQYARSNDDAVNWIQRFQRWQHDMSKCWNPRTQVQNRTEEYKGVKH